MSSAIAEQQQAFPPVAHFAALCDGAIAPLRDQLVSAFSLALSDAERRRDEVDAARSTYTQSEIQRAHALANASAIEAESLALQLARAHDLIDSLLSFSTRLRDRERAVAAQKVAFADLRVRVRQLRRQRLVVAPLVTSMRSSRLCRDALMVWRLAARTAQTSRSEQETAAQLSAHEVQLTATHDAAIQRLQARVLDLEQTEARLRERERVLRVQVKQTYERSVAALSAGTLGVLREGEASLSTVQSTPQAGLASGHMPPPPCEPHFQPMRSAVGTETASHSTPLGIEHRDETKARVVMGESSSPLVIYGDRVDVHALADDTRRRADALALRMTSLDARSSIATDAGIRVRMFE
jgi:hypothetical protein